MGIAAMGGYPHSVKQGREFVYADSILSEDFERADSFGGLCHYR